MSKPADVSILIVDDEEPARLLLRELIGRLPGYRVVGEAENGFEAVRLASETSPDVALLDIEMPKLSGLEVAELLDPGVAVVFVTAYDRYAVKAFEIHAADYVLKPFRLERLAEALERARGRARPSAMEAAALSAAIYGDGNYRTRIAVRDGARVQVISVDKLDLAEAQDDYVALRSEGRRFLKLQTLGSLAASLDPARFIRVHRSYLVHIDRIASLEQYARNSHVAVLVDGSRIPVSRVGYARLKAVLGEGSRSRV